jgi:hypothetical protein
VDDLDGGVGFILLALALVSDRNWGEAYDLLPAGAGAL